MTKARPKASEHDCMLRWTWVVAVAVIIFATIVRIRLLCIPLERDEGEFAYMGRLILDGIPPYKLAYSMKLPGIYVVYALVMSVFGQSTVGIHIGLLVANLSAAVLLFLLGRRLLGTQVGLLAAASYSILSLGKIVIGTAGHATQFVMPLALGGLLLLLEAIETGRSRTLFLSGLLMGLGFVTKQHAILFALFGLCYLLWVLIRARALEASSVAGRAALYAAGVVAPFAATCLIMYWAGVFDKFWFWTFTYAHQYASEIPLAHGLNMLTWIGQTFVLSCAAMLALSVVGLVELFHDPRLRKHAPFLVGLLVVSFLAVCPGFYFRRHYWVQMIPAVDLLSGLAIVQISSMLRGFKWVRGVPLIIFVAAVVQSVGWNRDLFFATTPRAACWAVYGDNPFCDSVEVARYLKEHTMVGDPIAVLGSEPQICFYADRRSASRHIYMYGLMEPGRLGVDMQREAIREIEAAKPKYILYIGHPQSWLCSPDSPTLVLQWGPDYCSRYYTITGVVDTISPAQTDYFWDEEAEYHPPCAPLHICVYEREPGM